MPCSERTTGEFPCVPGQHPSQQAPDVADFPSSLPMKLSRLPPAATGLPQALSVRSWVPKPLPIPVSPAQVPTKPQGSSPRGDGTAQGRHWDLLRIAALALLGLKTPVPKVEAGTAAGTPWPPHHVPPVPAVSPGRDHLASCRLHHTPGRCRFPARDAVGPPEPRFAVVCSCHRVLGVQRMSYKVFTCRSASLFPIFVPIWNKG